METHEKITALETYSPKSQIEEMARATGYTSESVIRALIQVVANQSEEIHELKEKFKKMNTRLLLPNQMVSTVMSSEDELDMLKLLLESDQWPMATDRSLICDPDSDQDKQDRAEGILDLIIDVHLEKLNFLDFGCGEGHVVNHALKQKPKMSVGYDVKESSKWEEWSASNNCLFTTDWKEVTKYAPYKVILLYDVIDHMMGDETQVIDALRKLKSVMTSDAKIFVRCHPWCSRHGTHLYHKINKAFLHLVFSQDELVEMGYEEIPAREIIHPIMSYNNIFQHAGLTLAKKEQIVKAPVESFFSDTPLVAKRIKRRYKHSPEIELREGKKFPAMQLEIMFVDYVLK